MSDGTDSFGNNFEGVVNFRGGGKAPGDGYDVGPRPFADDAYGVQDDTTSTRSSHSRATRGMDRGRYEPSQYGERGYAARDGYARDGRSEAYEQSQYGASPRAYPGNAVTRSGPGYGGYDRRRSYDDQDIDGYNERTRVTKYRRDNDRGLEPYREREKDRARSQDYRRDERPRSQGKRGSGSGSDDEREGDENTPMKKWAATFAGAAAGGLAANRFSKSHENNWVPSAIGAVVGGLLGREVEKKVYEHKERRKEKEHEERY